MFQFLQGAIGSRAKPAKNKLVLSQLTLLKIFFSCNLPSMYNHIKIPGVQQLE